MKTSIKTTALPLPIVIALIAMLTSRSAVGQQPADRGIVQAAFSQPASRDNTAQRVRFARQPGLVGDEVEQTIAVEMRLTMAMRQADQLVGKNEMAVRTNQRRVIATTEVDDGRTTGIKVRYIDATKQMLAADSTDTSAQPTIVPQPVQGKTYFCHRGPGEKGEIVVTDEAGNRPPTDEYEIVAQQMQMVGRPNPLAEFLAGRTIAVGEKVELPNEVASQIFNLGDRFGKVTRFMLTLQKVQPEGGVTRAVFHASVEAASTAAAQMRLEVEGPLVVEAATCRAQRIALAGPIGMSESRGTYSTAYQMIGTGRLQTSIASAYRDAKR